MISQIKTWRINCDRCQVEIIVHGIFSPSLPSGWGTRQVGGFGLTGYTKTEELCPRCYKISKIEDKNEKRT